MKFIPYGLHEITEEDIKEVVKVLKSDWVTTGPKIEEFEKAICSYTNTKYGTAVCNGTAALDIAVNGLGITEGSEVITTPFSFVASSNCLLFNKLRPVFADIKKDTFNIDPKEIRKKITDKTKAILYVDYAGQPCDIDEIREIAEEHNLFIIEDAAHAIGAEYKGKKIGNFADVTTFSFHPVKNITTGEGGIVVTNNKNVNDKLKLLRNHGMDKETMKRFGKDADWSYDVKMLARNYRITDFQCALGISQLKKIGEMIEKRQMIVERYKKEFENIKEITLPYVKGNIKHAWHLYTILLDEKINRDKFFRKMRQKNIGVNVLYIPIYHFSYYKKNFNVDKKLYPVTENVFKRVISLPLFPRMEDEDIEWIVDSVKKTIEELR